MNEKILIAGFGGQGVMFLGKVIAQVATKENFNTTWIPSYGAEMRGGTAHCFVRISSEKISSPVFEYPTTLFIFNQPSWDKFSSKIQKDTLVIVNTSLVDLPKNDGNIIGLSFNEAALKLGSLKIANMIALGVFLKNKNFVSLSVVEEVLREHFKENKEMFELNCKGLRWGFKNG